MVISSPSSVDPIACEIVRVADDSVLPAVPVVVFWLECAESSAGAVHAVSSPKLQATARNALLAFRLWNGLPSDCLLIDVGCGENCLWGSGEETAAASGSGDAGTVAVPPGRKTEVQTSNAELALLRPIG